MIFLKILLLSQLAFSYETSVTVKKVGEKKFFKAIVTTNFNASIEQVVAGIENFDDKCNNDRRSKRKFSKWEKNCSYHNENLVEAVKINKFESAPIVRSFPNAQYLMWRNIYNRGRFSHYDVITKTTENDSVQIAHKKLSEKLVGKALAKPEKIVSAFDDIIGVYKISKLNNGMVKVVYTYESSTDHWFLVRDFLEKSILENMAKGTQQAVKSIQQSLDRKMRKL